MQEVMGASLAQLPCEVFCCQEFVFAEAVFISPQSHDPTSSPAPSLALVFLLTSRQLMTFHKVIILLAWLDSLDSDGSRSTLLGQGTSLLGSKALSSGLTKDAEDVQVLQRCLAAGSDL